MEKDANDILLRTAEIKQQLGVTFGRVVQKHPWPHPLVVQVGGPLHSMGCVPFSWGVQARHYCHFLAWLFMHQKSLNQISKGYVG